jgi:hypothetical protein
MYVMRVVRSAHSIQVVRLHHLKVLTSPLCRNGPSKIRVMLMEVDPVQQHGLAVDQ